MPEFLDNAAERFNNVREGVADLVGKVVDVAKSPEGKARIAKDLLAPYADKPPEVQKYIIQQEINKITAIVDDLTENFQPTEAVKNGLNMD